MWSTVLWCFVFIVTIGVLPPVSSRLSPLDELLKTRFSTTTTKMAENHRVTTEGPSSHNFWEKHHTYEDDDYYDEDEEKDMQQSKEVEESSEETDEYGDDGYGDDIYGDHKYGGHRHSAKKYSGEKHSDKKYDDDKYDDEKYDDEKYYNDKYDDERYDGDDNEDGQGLQHLGGRHRHSGHGHQGHASSEDLLDDYQAEDERPDAGSDGDAYGDDTSAEGGRSQAKDSDEDDDDGNEAHASAQREDSVQNDDNSAWGGGHHMSPYSERKWNTLGTRKAVEASRNSRLGSRGHSPYRNDENEVQLAVENALRVNREHECRWPVARLVRVKDVFPQPNKRYIPHCASLHQCADDTGCCHSDTLACVPAKTHPVSLYFYSTTLGSGRGYMVEKLTFYNHTECRCEDRLDAQMPRDMALPLHTPRLQPPENRRSIAGGCRCPSHFAVRRLNAGAVCLCECYGNHQICLRQRRGKEYFSQADKHCIQSGECALPGCEYGQYLLKAGRCPRKRERLNVWNAVHHRLYSH